MEIVKVDDELLNRFMNTWGIANQLTPQEKSQFMEISKAYNLNPLKREIHVTAYGEGQYRKLSIITGYEVYLKRAERTGKLDGIEVEDFGTLEPTEVMRRVKGGKLEPKNSWGGDYGLTVKVYRKDWSRPFVHTVHFEEFSQHNQIWIEKPKFMLRKVGIAQAYRLAFPDELGGLPYIEEEVYQDFREEKTDSIQGEFEEIKTPPDLYKALEAEVLNLMNTRVKPVNSPDADKYSDFERMIIDVKELYKNAMSYRDTEKLILLKKRIEFYEQYRGTDLQEQALNFIEKKGDDYQSLTFENFEND
jgi:phage recombination protein Bet